MLLLSAVKYYLRRAYLFYSVLHVVLRMLSDVAAAAAEVDDGRGESPSGDDDDDRGRVAVRDSAARCSAAVTAAAQMFSPICSTAAAAEPPTSSASFSGTINGGLAPSSPADSAAASGLADPRDVCFSPRTIPSSDDTDILSTTFGAASPPHNPAHLEADNASSLLPVTSVFRNPSDNSSDVVHDETSRRLCRADISTRKTTTDFVVGEDAAADAKLPDQQCEVSSEASRQPSAPSGNDSSSVRPTAVTAAVSSSPSLDPYETICDDLLESIDDGVSDTMERCRHPNSASGAAAAACCADIIRQPSVQSSEPTRKRDTALTGAVVVDSIDVERPRTSSGEHVGHGSVFPNPSQLKNFGSNPTMDEPNHGGPNSFNW